MFAEKLENKLAIKKGLLINGFKKACVDSLEESPSGFLFDSSIGLIHPLKGIAITIPNPQPIYDDDGTFIETILFEVAGIEPRPLNFSLSIFDDDNYHQDIHDNDFAILEKYMSELVNIEATRYILKLARIYTPVKV